jgi:hypothetical protein
MSQEYEQFLGSRPGLIVQLVDSGTSPYTLRTSDGFEFIVSADDFNNFYRLRGEKNPARWEKLVTDDSTGLIDTQIIAPLIELVHHFEIAYNDFSKARYFLRWTMKKIMEGSGDFVTLARKKLARDSRSPELISDDDLKRLLQIDEKQKELLLSATCAVISWPVGKPSDSIVSGLAPEKKIKSENVRKKTSEVSPGTTISRMKNVEILIDENMMTIMIDLSKDLGPSKSGRNNLVATTEGNKTIPGRDAKIGLTVYRETSPKVVKKGAKDSFKNVRMEVDQDILTLFVDLTIEVGPSKSGKNMILATTGGNQLVFSRPEKIGLNVYRAI